MKKLLLITTLLCLATPANAANNEALWYATDSDRIVKVYGQNFKKRVNALMPKAYDAVLNSNANCREVIAVQPSTQYSDPDYPVVQVTCESKNGRGMPRFLVDENLFVVAK